MRVTLLAPGQAQSLLVQHLGCAPDSFEGIADLIRHEVSARVRSHRHFVIGRVCRAAARLVSLDPKLVGDVCDELEREGDVLLADGGVIHPAPIRFVALGSGDFRVVGAVPSARLFASVPGQWSQRRARRRCTVSLPIEPIASALGGIVVTPEVWSGFDRVPSADAEWIRGLDARLSSSSEPVGSLEHDGLLDWTGLDVSHAEPHWRSGSLANLWRARHPWRRWVYAWTSGASPSKTPFVSLYPDEGARTVYAQARVNEGGLRGSLSRHEGAARVAIPGWLPLSEYRYLSMCAERVDAPGRGSVWAVPLAREEDILATLHARLGLQFDEKPA